ncbi:MAG: hypothetical protein JWM14_1698 [Chitinophagaceae bacterium]|nr:hypothetical protein [Chitinophagaceae bacterium]
MDFVYVQNITSLKGLEHPHRISLPECCLSEAIAINLFKQFLIPDVINHRIGQHILHGFTFFDHLTDKSSRDI